MTGWRLGVSIWPDALVAKVTRLCVNSLSGVNAPAQFAGIAALTGPQDDVHAMVKAFDERRRIVPMLTRCPPASTAIKGEEAKGPKESSVWRAGIIRGWG